MTEPIFQRFTIIGAGLMGTSLALALKEKGAVAHVELCDISPEALKVAAHRHAAHGYEPELASAVRGAEAVCLATPVGAFAALVAAIAPQLETGAILTDLGSVKGVMARAAHPTLPGHVALVPAHPLVGGATSGAGAADAALFQGARVILTPEAGAPRTAVDRVAGLWRAIGAEVRELPADVHDAALAWTSHLPQVVASALAATLGDRAEAWGEALFSLSGRGLDDMTRLAGSDPDMWADILLANRDAIAEAARGLRRRLDAFAAALEVADRAAARDLIEAGQAARRRYEAGRRS